MFGIKLAQAKKVLSEMQAQLKIFNRIIFEIEEVISKTEKENREVCMTRRLRTELEELNLQRKKLLELISSLRIVVELYEETEKEVLEYEGMVSPLITHETDWIPLNFSEEAINFIKQIRI